MATTKTKSAPKKGARAKQAEPTEVVEETPKGSPISGSTVDAEGKALATQGSQAVSTETAASDGYSDEVETSDLQIPTLNIIQKVGDLSDAYPQNQGWAIFNKELVFNTLEEPFVFVLIGLLPKRFSEKLQGGEQGRLFNTREEVLEVGGAFTKKEALATGKPHFQELVGADLLVRKPDDLDDEAGIFQFEIDGHQYGVFRYWLKGTSYFAAAKKFYSARQLGALKKNWSARRWTFTTAIQKFDGGSAFVPVVTLSSEATEGELEFCRNFRG